LLEPNKRGIPVKESRPKEASADLALEELARRLLVMVRDSGEKREIDLRSAIAQKIKEAEVSNEDQ
jgi:hypothetical protein